MLDKVDKYWPVPGGGGGVTKTEVKEEPLDTVEEAEWEEAAEEEILAANKEFLECSPPPAKPSPRRTKPRRRRAGKKSYKEDYESEDPDDPDELNDSPIFADDDEDDPDFEGELSDESFSPDLFDEGSAHSMEEDEEEGLDMSLVKEEIDDIEEVGEEGSSSKECKVVEIGGFKVETYGDYSKCPKCLKNIKSTFIIRHIKLHDLPTHTMNCPYSDCTTSFTRSNNMYRHLKVKGSDWFCVSVS